MAEMKPLSFPHRAAAQIHDDSDKFFGGLACVSPKYCVCLENSFGKSDYVREISHVRACGCGCDCVYVWICIVELIEMVPQYLTSI